MYHRSKKRKNLFYNADLSVYNRNLFVFFSILRYDKSVSYTHLAAKAIGGAYGCAVLLKGGHSVQDANDLLYAGGTLQWFEGARIQNPNTHGTGCTLSSAIAANLAKGFSLPESVRRAKAYISGALAAMLDLGQGSGPMNHAWTLQGTFAEESD